MRTAIYIDGYNLYYGVIHNTEYKWLDIVSLFEVLTRRVNVDSRIVKVGYFTARVKSKLSKHGQTSYTSQDSYLRALEKKYPEIFTVTLGRHMERKQERIKYQEPIDIQNKVAILNVEEKQTDVNIALDIYKDALSGKYDQLVLVTSDSDLEPALKLIKKDCPSVELGVVLPIRGSFRRSGSLKQHADWLLNNIGEHDLGGNQLPNVIRPSKGKIIVKPSYW